MRARCDVEARRLVAELDPLPLPGGGETLSRWRALAAVATGDLSVARIVEGHVDAVAILAELGRPERVDGLLGVWAARPAELRASPSETGWVLTGEKPYCSGAGFLDAALLTATAPDGPRLFLVDASVAVVEPDTWRPLGMADTRSETLRFDDVDVGPTAAVGDVDAYVARPGFGHGGSGVAAVWWGGARALLGDIAAATCAAGNDHVLAAFGRAASAVEQAASVLREAAAAIDRAPRDLDTALGTATSTRVACAEAGRVVLDVAGRVLGTSSVGNDPSVAAHVADLTTYLTQHHDDAILDLARSRLATMPRL